ncbi:AraC family transcriptional regulator [Luteimonas terricola]|uniref:AraC family transcriptional regulator n=1 Tax=Luteimonas terricola TaxID=645597 RepID=A0ABQ2EDR1_9GAMM|nr:AraC family transcriptional regulator [Luteimonas terricola]GGK07821.1 AraC family transcriptional regulator [Luteimonas terricola]
MQPPVAIDRLSGVLDRFRVRTELHHSGELCGISHFDAGEGYGYLHVLRSGQLDVRHPGARDVPRSMHFDEPTLLFYPRPLTHQFHNPPVDGPEFTCARLCFEGGAANPLARALPPLIALPLARVPGLGAAIELLLAETGQVRCGHRLLADRLFEVVLIQLLRWLLDHPAEAGVSPGLITGLSDPRLACALVAMHEAPGESWTLERMAQVAGMSRTAYVNLFRERVGQTPADYLNDWRIALAQGRLRAGQPMKLLAEQLGYANPSALSRAFKAKVGVSPRAWLGTTGARADAFRIRSSTSSPVSGGIPGPP